MQVHLNKIENRITWKIKTGCYIEFLTPYTTKIFESTEKRSLKIMKMYLI